MAMPDDALLDQFCVIETKSLPRLCSHGETLRPIASSNASWWS